MFVVDVFDSYANSNLEPFRENMAMKLCIGIRLFPNSVPCNLSLLVTFKDAGILKPLKVGRAHVKIEDKLYKV